MIVSSVYEMPLELTRCSKAAGTAQPSFTTNHLQDPDLTPAKEDLIRWASNSMFAGTQTAILFAL